MAAVNGTPRETVTTQAFVPKLQEVGSCRVRADSTSERREGGNAAWAWPELTNGDERG